MFSYPLGATFGLPPALRPVLSSAVCWLPLKSLKICCVFDEFLPADKANWYHLMHSSGRRWLAGSIWCPISYWGSSLISMIWLSASTCYWLLLVLSCFKLAQLYCSYHSPVSASSPVELGSHLPASFWYSPDCWSSAGLACGWGICCGRVAFVFRTKIGNDALTQPWPHWITCFFCYGWIFFL